jgi:hypothetical protein
MVPRTTTTPADEEITPQMWGEIEQLIAARQSEMENLLDWYAYHRVHLVLLMKGRKRPTAELAWPDLPNPSRACALDHLMRGGNVGLNLGKSNLLGIDSDNDSASGMLLRRGFDPVTEPANAKNYDHPKGKFGGCHFLWRVPAEWGVTGDQVRGPGRTTFLPDGAKFDALAGRRYLVLPPSVIGEYDHVATYDALDAMRQDIPVFPRALWGAPWEVAA